MVGWYMGYWGSGRALINGTGRTVYDVHISRQGRMTVSNRRDWTRDEPEVVDGGVIPIRYDRAQGANQDPPYFRVEYSASPEAEGDRIVENIDAP